MTATYRFFHRALVRAPIAVCWDVFTDHERLGEFTVATAYIKTPGKDDRNGLGCTRCYGGIDEHVFYWKVNSIFGYRVVNSAVIVAHQGIVRFFDRPSGGCEWVYDMRIVPGEPLIAQAESLKLDFKAMMEPPFRSLMHDFEAECERRAGPDDILAAPIPTDLPPA